MRNPLYRQHDGACPPTRGGGKKSTPEAEALGRSRGGLIGAKVSAEAAHRILLTLLPNEPHILYNFHISHLKHGQQLCVWGTPKCPLCPLKDVCNWYAANRALYEKP